MRLGDASDADGHERRQREGAGDRDDARDERGRQRAGEREREELRSRRSQTSQRGVVDGIEVRLADERLADHEQTGDRDDHGEEHEGAGLGRTPRSTLARVLARVWNATDSFGTSACDVTLERAHVGSGPEPDEHAPEHHRRPVLPHERRGEHRGRVVEALVDDDRRLVDADAGDAQPGQVRPLRVLPATDRPELGRAWGRSGVRSR